MKPKATIGLALLFAFMGIGCSDPQVTSPSESLQVTLEIPTASASLSNLIEADVTAVAEAGHEIHCEDFFGNSIGDSCTTNEAGSCSVTGLTMEQMTAGFICIGDNEGAPIYSLIYLTDDEITAALRGESATVAINALTSYVYALVFTGCANGLDDCDNAADMALEIDNLISSDDAGTGATSSLYDEFANTLAGAGSTTDATTILINALSGGDDAGYSTEFLTGVTNVLEAIEQGDDPSSVDVLAAAPNTPTSLSCTTSPAATSTGNTCTLTAASPTDPNGGSVTYVDAVSTCTTTSISSDGQTITFTAPAKDASCLVKIKAYDGALYSEAVSSATITGVNNAPATPSTLSCVIEPIADSTANTCTLTVASPTDADSDSVTYVDAGSTCTAASVSADGSTITFTAPALDDTCLVKVKAYDGSAYSELVSSATITGVYATCMDFNEDFNDGDGASAFTQDCWNTFTSDYFSAQTASSFTTTTFSYNSVLQNTRNLTITKAAGMGTNATVDYTPFATPDTGWDSGQWPYIMDLARIDEGCSEDAKITVQIKPTSTDNTDHIHGLVLNADITGSGASRSISGYFIHANAGGNSVTLAKFEDAFDHAFDYLDHFPGQFGDPNPKTDGPYKGWDFKRSTDFPGAPGVWPSGGSPNGMVEHTLAAEYIYDSGTGNVTINWEVRQANGTDSSPGSWDMTRVLTGADALPPAWGYGHYLSFYGAIQNNGENNIGKIGDVTVTCP